MTLRLTPGERLIVVMLADLMDAMKVNREIDPQLVKRLAIANDDWALEMQYSGIFDGDGPTDTEIEETMDILDMWTAIERSVEDLEPEEQAELKALRWQFSGFDGNNDAHHGIAGTLINDLGKWAHFSGRNLNSHSRATLSRYRVMLRKFRAEEDRTPGEPLTADQLRTILTMEPVESAA